MNQIRLEVSCWRKGGPHSLACGPKIRGQEADACAGAPARFRHRPYDRRFALPRITRRSRHILRSVLAPQHLGSQGRLRAFPTPRGRGPSGRGKPTTAERLPCRSVSRPRGRNQCAPILGNKLAGFDSRKPPGVPSVTSRRLSSRSWPVPGPSGSRNPSAKPASLRHTPMSRSASLKHPRRDKPSPSAAPRSRYRPSLERAAHRRHALGAAHEARGQHGRDRRAARRDR